MPKKRRRGTPRTLPVGVTQREDGRLALTVGGVTQSISVREADGAEPGGYWPLMLGPACPARALLLGLGGATVAWLLARRCPGARLLGVERDAATLALARESFGLDALPTLKVVEADAFDWVAAQFDADVALAADEPRYDLICVDLFEGGRLVAGTLATPFLRQIAALLAPGGLVSVNLMLTGRTPEQLHRLRRVFAIVREQRLHGNIVLHLTPLPSVAIDENEATTAAPPTHPQPPAPPRSPEGPAPAR